MPDIFRSLWRLLRIAAGGPGRWFSFLMLAFVAGCQFAGIQITLRLIQWRADFYNALQRVDAPAALTQITVFAGLIGISAALHLMSTFVRQHIQIRWRRRLTDAVLDQWLPRKAFWFLQPAFNHPHIDNHDQRIAEDCREFVESILTKCLDFLMSLVGLYAFVMVLWELSSFPLAFTFLGLDVEIPRYMVWAAPLYVAIATGLTHALGRQMPGLLAEQQKREADFRFALMRVREHASAIALSNGEAAESVTLSQRFDHLVQNWKKVIGREFIYGLFQRPNFQTVLRVPMFLALPAFLAGKVTLGGLMQVASAFQNTVTTLSWFVFNYKFVSDLAATTRRLQRFLDAIENVDRNADGKMVSSSGGRALRANKLIIRAPDGRSLLQLDEFSVEKGEAVWLSGASGLGKSTLLKAFAQLWPHAEGALELPGGRLHFQPQQVYMPLGPLMAAAVYPADPASVPREAVEKLLRQVGLARRLDADEQIAEGLSVGEQQRLALARLIIARPDWAFLDEATSALDPVAERSVMELLRSELPETTFIIVAHREPVGFQSLRRVFLEADTLEGAVGARQLSRRH